nr:MAG TPA: hypothetical protein [Caudoviricetes sp.]
MVTLKPITDWWGNVIRYEEMPTGADPAEPTSQNVANTIHGSYTYHLTRGGIPSPVSQEHPEAQAKYPPVVSPAPSKR